MTLTTRFCLVGLAVAMTTGAVTASWYYWTEAVRIGAIHWVMIAGAIAFAPIGLVLGGIIGAILEPKEAMTLTKRLGLIGMGVAMISGAVVTYFGYQTETAPVGSPVVVTLIGATCYAIIGLVVGGIIGAIIQAVVSSPTEVSNK